jgi:hypothetical protein
MSTKKRLNGGAIVATTSLTSVPSGKVAQYRATSSAATTGMPDKRARSNFSTPVIGLGRMVGAVAASRARSGTTSRRAGGPRWSVTVPQARRAKRTGQSYPPVGRARNARHNSRHTPYPTIRRPTGMKIEYGYSPVPTSAAATGEVGRHRPKRGLSASRLHHAHRHCDSLVASSDVGVLAGWGRRDRGFVAAGGRTRVARAS